MTDPNPYLPTSQTNEADEATAVTNRFRIVATVITLTAVILFIGVAIAASMRASPDSRSIPTPYYLSDDEESETPD